MRRALSLIEGNNFMLLSFLGGTSALGPRISHTRIILCRNEYYYTLSCVWNSWAHTNGNMTTYNYNMLYSNSCTSFLTYVCIK